MYPKSKALPSLKPNTTRMHDQKQMQQQIIAHSNLILSKMNQQHFCHQIAFLSMVDRLAAGKSDERVARQT